MSIIITIAIPTVEQIKTSLDFTDLFFPFIKIVFKGLRVVL